MRTAVAEPKRSTKVADIGDPAIKADTESDTETICKHVISGMIWTDEQWRVMACKGCGTVLSLEVHANQYGSVDGFRPYARKTVEPDKVLWLPGLK